MSVGDLAQEQGAAPVGVERDLDLEESRLA